MGKMMVVVLSEKIFSVKTNHMDVSGRLVLFPTLDEFCLGSFIRYKHFPTKRVCRQTGKLSSLYPLERMGCKVSGRRLVLYKVFISN